MDTNNIGFHHSINYGLLKQFDPVFLSSSDAHLFYVVWFLRSNSLIYIYKKTILKNLQCNL